MKMLTTSLIVGVVGFVTLCSAGSAAGQSGPGRTQDGSGRAAPGSGQSFGTAHDDAQAAGTVTPAQTTAALHALFRNYDEWGRQVYPESAMSRGDYRYARTITDASLTGIEERHRARIDFLDRLNDLDRSHLADADQVSYDFFELTLRNAIDAHHFRTFLAPISGRSGPQQDIPQMASGVRFKGEDDFENYLVRLEQTPALIEHVITRLKLGVAEGRVPPRITVESVPRQIAALLAPNGLDDLAVPLNTYPDHINSAFRARLRQRFETTTLPAVRDALRAFGEYVANEYVPACRESIAAADWPDGAAFYDYQLRVMTTTELTAQEIHEIGLREVARIRAEMMDVIRRSDFLTAVRTDLHDADDATLFAEFRTYLRSDPRFYYDTPEELVEGYRAICKQIDPWMIKLFNTLPRLPYGVVEIPAFMAPNQTTAYYDPGNLENAKPGYYYVNTYALDQRPKYEMVALSLHEAVPGHHHQISLAQEIEDLPPFRQQTYLTAFGEGWALYAERLGIEMGLYEDPYNDFGRLTYEMWRACRLVVDPGMHALSWSRDQAVAFMLDNSALSELNINNEIDRYISWPGQACGYKIGELKIRELRERAEDRLGESFDLREFHDVVLTAGAIPLPVLAKRVDSWLLRQVAPMQYD
jgi:uncharacterized protein (DUF885 family)